MKPWMLSCRCAECRYAECRYAECRNAERGTILTQVVPCNVSH
jgi:hypothetical protein